MVFHFSWHQSCKKLFKLLKICCWVVDHVFDGLVCLLHRFFHDQKLIKFHASCWGVVEKLLSCCCVSSCQISWFSLSRDGWIHLKEVPVFTHVFNALFELLQSCCCVCCKLIKFVVVDKRTLFYFRFVLLSMFRGRFSYKFHASWVVVHVFALHVVAFSSYDKTSLFYVTNLQSACCCGHVVYMLYMFDTGLHASCWVVVPSQAVFLCLLLSCCCMLYMLVMHSIAYCSSNHWSFAFSLICCCVVLSWVDWKQESMTEAASSERISSR